MPLIILFSHKTSAFTENAKYVDKRETRELEVRRRRWLFVGDLKAVRWRWFTQFPYRLGDRNRYMVEEKGA